MTTFLIIDDSATIRKMIMAALKPMNASFSEAATGLDAIEKLTLRGYDAITLDLNMPDMHGLEFLQFLRSHTSFKELPVMVITTRSDPAVLQKALDAGADHYLLKPFKPAELLNGMQVLLEQKKLHT